jgi:hypothetical protein
MFPNGAKDLDGVDRVVAWKRQGFEVAIVV